MFSGISPIAVAEKFDLKIIGPSNELIKSIGSIHKQGRDFILWVKNQHNLDKIKEGYVIVSADVILSKKNDHITYLVTNQKPRLIFAKVINDFFSHELNEDFSNHVEHHKLNSEITIGDHVFIGKDVLIGDGTIVHPNVVIYPKTVIGKNCVIRTHVSLGTEGLGLEMDADSDSFIKFPQLGGVILEDNVEIGPTSTVRRSALDDTIIKKGTKIGSLVNIGHNCVIGSNCILTCQIVTSGSSVIGDNVFMGVNSIVKNGVNIGNDVTIGQGAVVTKNVPNGTTYVGNPAEDINDYKAWSKLKKKLTEMFGKDV